MKKAAQHQMWREDASAAIESLAVGGSGIEELIGTAMYSSLAVDAFLCSGEFALKNSLVPFTAKDPNWQWAVDHRVILAGIITSLTGLVGFDVAGFKPFGWLGVFLAFPKRWGDLLNPDGLAVGTGDQAKLPALPMADRLMLSAFLPSLMYTMVRVIANVPRLVGDLLPG